MIRKMMMGLMVLGLVVAMLPRVAEAGWAQATGGHAYEDTIDGVTWMIHVFTNVGEHVNALEITQAGNIEYLIVAGGGAGGTTRRSGPTAVGGGGAGGLLEGTMEVSVGTTTVVVGGGGEPSTSRATPGGNGENSSAFGLTAIGGGGGGLEQTAGNYLNAVLQRHTFGQRARLFDADGEIIHSTDGNNTFSISAQTWIPATFTWTPTNGLTGTFELSWMVGDSARGPLVADDYTLNSDEAFVGFGTGREPGRFDNISVTGFPILPQGTVLIVK